MQCFFFKKQFSFSGLQEKKSRRKMFIQRYLHLLLTRLYFFGAWSCTKPEWELKFLWLINNSSMFAKQIPTKKWQKIELGIICKVTNNSLVDKSNAICLLHTFINRNRQDKISFYKVNPVFSFKKEESELHDTELNTSNSFFILIYSLYIPWYRDCHLVLKLDL